MQCSSLCVGTNLQLLVFFEDPEPSRNRKSHKLGLALGLSLGCICLLIFGFGFFLWRRQRLNQQIFFDVNGQYRGYLFLKHQHQTALKALLKDFTKKILSATIFASD